jgi:hypothetical protein
MRIERTSLILLFGVFLWQQAPRAEDTLQGNDTPTQERPAESVAPDTGNNKDDAPAYQSDIVSLQDLLEDKMKRVVGSAYTVNFSAYGALGFVYTQQHDYTKDKTQNLTFKVPFAGLNFSGNLREDPKEDFDLKYILMLYYSGNGISLLDVNLKWDLYSTKRSFDPPWTLSATIGQQQVPFGADNQAAEDKRPTINLAQYLGKYGVSRDIGVKLDQGFLNSTDNFTGVSIPKIALTLAGFNGAGFNAIDSLDRRSKDLLAKVIITPLGDHYFSLLGQFSFGGTAWWRDVDYNDNKIDNQVSRYGVEVSWLKKPLLVTGEWVYGSAAPATPAAASVKSAGWVGTVFFTPTTLPTLQPLARFDFFDPNRANTTPVNKSDATTVVTAGFNWFFYQTEPLSRRPYPISETNRVIKLQLNYNWKLEQDADGSLSDKINNNELLLQAFFNF